MKTKFLITLAALLIVALNSFTQGWNLTGNSGTNTSTNFLGTTDKKGLVLRTNNFERLRITQAGYVGIGIINPQQKLDVNGNINIAADSGLYINNIKVLHTKGNGNIFVGSYSGINNLGSHNTATGYNALSGYPGNNNTGSYNTAFGDNALYFNTTGIQNVALGPVALYNNTAGSFNIALGSSALYDLVSGSSNTAVGNIALTYLLSGSDNTVLGAQAMLNDAGDRNVAVGANAMGHVDGYGLGNTACGYSALFSTNNNENITAIGINALYNVQSSSLLTAIGCNTDANSSYTNSTALGNAALITASNQVRVGNSNVKSIGGYVGWTKISDGRVKKNIKENVPGLSFINKLKPITYNLNLDAADKIVQRPAIKTKDGKTFQPTQEDIAARKAQEQIVYTGFIAQNVEKAAKELNYDFSGVDVAKNDKDLYGLRYEEFVVPLVKAVQELSAKNDDLQKRIEILEALLNKQSSPLSESSENSRINLSNTNIKISPNPVQSILNIEFNKEAVSNKTINIYDVNGKLLITKSVAGNTQIDVRQLTAGAYVVKINDTDGRILFNSKLIKQ